MTVAKLFLFFSAILIPMTAVIGFVIYYTVQIVEEETAWCNSQGYSTTHVGRSGTLCETKEGYLLRPFTSVKPQ